MSDCNHGNKTPTGSNYTCLDCGLELGSTESYPECEPEWRNFSDNSNDNSRVFIRRLGDRSIITDLETLGFEKEVCIDSNDLYIKATKNDILRGNSRRGVMFACVFFAYKLHNKAKTPEELNKSFKITKKIISKGMKFYNLRREAMSTTEHIQKTSYIEPLDFIPSILNKLELDNIKLHSDNINKIYKLIENRSSLINRSNPQSVASGLVFYYCQLNNIDLNCYKFSRKIGLSDITVGKIYRNIHSILSESSPCPVG